MQERDAPHLKMRVLGIPVDIINLPNCVQTILRWTHQSDAKMVFVREIPSLMLAVKNDALAELHRSADLVVPDGTPLVWLGRLRGHGDKIGRVAGADLLEETCRHTVSTGESHFFYGGGHGVAEKLAARLTAKYTGLRVAGTYSPPFRKIDEDFELTEDIMQEVRMLRRSDADFIWIGLSSPKQEFWMAKVKPVLDRGVLLGVGAAFDFLSGGINRAPRWMRNNGLEWLYRLVKEPRRLWRRYLLLAPLFVVKIFVEEARRLTGERRNDH